MAIDKLLFVDSNIWLDFYRGRNETGVGLVKHAEAISEKIIATYLLESEFKRNRQNAIKEGMEGLKAPPHVPRPGIFSNTHASIAITRNFENMEKRIAKLKIRLVRALDNPTVSDPIYKACQRIFHRKNSPIILTRSNRLRHSIRRLAFNRFLYGCPPRKRNDTSIGDAFNWEWMIHCAKEHGAELVIVSRDGDYGTTFGEKTYVNDDLRQEFSERVSKKRKVLLCTKLSDALKHFQVPVTAQEEEAETEIVESVEHQTSAEAPVTLKEFLQGFKGLEFELDKNATSYTWSDMASLGKRTGKSQLPSFGKHGGKA